MMREQKRGEKICSRLHYFYMYLQVTCKRELLTPKLFSSLTKNLGRPQRVTRHSVVLPMLSSTEVILLSVLPTHMPAQELTVPQLPRDIFWVSFALPRKAQINANIKIQ